MGLPAISSRPELGRSRPDLFFAGWRCRWLRVVLIGEQNQRRMLPILNCLPDCPRRCYILQIAPYDISEYKLDFEPVKIRLQGIYGPSTFKGFQLSMVRARTARANADEPAPADND